LEIQLDVALVIVLAVLLVIVLAQRWEHVWES